MGDETLIGLFHIKLKTHPLLIKRIETTLLDHARKQHGFLSTQKCTTWNNIKDLCSIFCWNFTDTFWEHPIKP